LFYIGEVELEFALLVGGVQWAAIALLGVVARKVTTNSKGFGKAIAIVSCDRTRREPNSFWKSKTSLASCMWEKTVDTGGCQNDDCRAVSGQQRSVVSVPMTPPEMEVRGRKGLDEFGYCSGHTNQ
jgi:hypothetical protein